MKNILLVILAVIAGYLGAQFAPLNKAEAEKKETAYERVMRTNVLRCGYGVWAPGLVKDPQTGQLSGIFHDYLEAIAAHTGIKVEWTTEVGWGDYPTALNSGRIDAMCFGAWPKATIAKENLFTKPVYYLPVYAYVRADDTRFDNDLSRANAADITISTMDAELSGEIAAASFENAKTISVPQLSPQSLLLLNVALKKADITFTDAWTAADYISKNPGQLKQVANMKPLRLFGHTLPLAMGEQNLLAMLNTATDEIVGTGEMDAIIQKYASIPGVLLVDKHEYK